MSVSQIVCYERMFGSRSDFRPSSQGSDVQKKFQSGSETEQIPQLSFKKQLASGTPKKVLSLKGKL